MIDVFKFISGKYDANCSVKLLVEDLYLVLKTEAICIN